MNIIPLVITDLITMIIWYNFPGKILTFKEKRKWLFAVMIILTFIEAFSTRLFPILFTNTYKPLVYFSQFALYIFFAFKDSIQQKALAFSLFAITITVTDLMSLAFLSLLRVDQNDNIGGITGNLITSIFCAVVSYIIFFGISIIYSKIKNKKITNKTWQFQIIIISQVMFTIVTVFSNYSNGTLDSITMKSPIYLILMLLTILVAVIGDICLYRILITNSQNYELKNELELMQTKNQLELDYYEKLKKNVTETRKINHDFNNILTVIQHTILSSDSPENKAIALKTVEEIKETLAKNKVRNYCENELVNLIIISKLEDITNAKIDFSANLNIPQNINIKNSDLCRIFTNLLDNAKESCELANNKDKCFIVLSAQIIDSYLHITSENYYDSQVNQKKDKLLSTKENHKGLGIEIIKEIAKSHSGDYVCNYDNNIFTSSVSLKIS